MALQGHCLCKSVVIIADDQHELHACHCAICRHWGSGAMFTLQSEQVSIEHRDNITHYSSSDWAQRGFCKTCGTHLYYHLKGTQQYYLSAGLFEHAKFELKSQIFIDKKACYYELANQTPQYTEAEFLAMMNAD